MATLEHADVSLSEAGAWDLFVEEAQGGTFYHSSAWLSSLAAMGQQIRIHAVAGDGTICAGAVVRVGGRYGLSVGKKPWATAYNGIVSRGGTGARAGTELAAMLLRRYCHVRLVHSPWESCGSAACAQWKVRQGTTAILDISDPPLLWKAFDRRARQRVRKAASLGVQVREMDELTPFYYLYRLTYERQGLPMPLGSDEITATLALARQRQSIKLYEAVTRTGEPAAALVIGFDGKRAYFALAASHPSLRKTDAMTLLWWRVIQVCAESHSEIDLVGMDIPSIATFKNSFSPRLLPFIDASCYSSTGARWMMRGAELARNVGISLRQKGR
jgi:hypothetical protein